MSTHRVPYSALFPFSPLFKQYCSNYNAVAEYYNGDFRQPEARRIAAERAASFPRDRETLVKVLLEQNERWGLDDKTRRRIEVLCDPRSVTVVTGQQAGLFTGPLYTIYKTITTLQLAKQVADETGRPVIPVFWVGGEDHDFDEIAGLTLMSRYKPVSIRYNGHIPPEQGNGGAVGRIILNSEIEDMISRIDELLPNTVHKEELMGCVRDVYRPGTTIGEAFTRFMRKLFDGTGLVFISADDVRLKRLSIPLFRRELEDYQTVTAYIQAAGQKLETDFHAQVHASPTNLLLFEAEGRLPLDVDGTEFLLRGTEKRFSRSEILQLLVDQPERFSPNVVLRPLMQDVILPTAAYVAGPGEIAYYAQYKQVYQWAGLPMPIIYPRVGVSIVGTRVRKTLEKYDLSVEDFETDFERFFRRFVLERMAVDIDVVFNETLQHIHQAIDLLKPSLEEIDHTLQKSAEATRVALGKELERFKGRVIKAEKRNQEVARGQLEKAFVNIFPNGKMQERVFSVLQMLNQHGFDFIDELLERLSLDTSSHQVLSVDG